MTNYDQHRNINRASATLQDMVEEFHEHIGAPTGDRSAPGFNDDILRMSLLHEEVKELQDAVDQLNMVDAADAIADCVYVLLGSAVAWGIELGPILAEVHRSNMTKEPARAGVKAKKGPNYEPPDVKGCLDAQRDFYTAAPTEDEDIPFA